MRRSLLDMVQGILSALNSDAVSSLSDTNEAMQVAERVKEAYLDLIVEQGLPANHSITTLDPLSSPTSPHVMRLPERASRLVWFKYDISDIEYSESITTDSDGNEVRTVLPRTRKFVEIPFKDPKDFVEHINHRDSMNTTEFFTWAPPDSPSLTLMIGYKAHPSYWTTFDDEHVTFDSYNSLSESSLQASRSQAYCEMLPTFEMRDDYVPDLPDNLFTMLYNTALNRCFVLDKESINPKFEQQENRSRVRSQRLKFRQERDQNKFYSYPDYGRRHR